MTIKKITLSQRAEIHSHYPETGYKMILLQREGAELLIRDKNGYWEIFEYCDNYGSERWGKIPDNINVEEHIEKYGNLSY